MLQYCQVIVLGLPLGALLWIGWVVAFDSAKRPAARSDKGAEETSSLGYDDSDAESRIRACTELLCGTAALSAGVVLDAAWNSDSGLSWHLSDVTRGGLHVSYALEAIFWLVSIFVLLFLSNHQVCQHGLKPPWPETIPALLRFAWVLQVIVRIPLVGLLLPVVVPSLHEGRVTVPLLATHCTACLFILHTFALPMLYHVFAFGVCVLLGPFAFLALLLAIAVPFCEWLIFRRSREYLDGAAAAQLTLMDGCNVTSILVLGEKTSHEAILRRMVEVFLGTEPMHERFHRLREYPVVSKFGNFWAHWRVDTDFDASRHVVRHRHLVGHAEVEVSLAVMQGADGLAADRPLWQLHVFERYAPGDGPESSALVLRISRAYADGFTLLRVLMQGAEVERPLSRARERLPSRGAESQHAPPDSIALAAPVAARVQQAAEALRAARKLLLAPRDPPSLLKASRCIGPRGVRHTAWHRVDATVDEVRAVARKHGATVNDVLIASLCLVLRDTAKRGASKHRRKSRGGSARRGPLDVNVAMSVSLNSSSDIYKSHEELPISWTMERLGCVNVKLPIGADRSPTEALAEVQAEMQKLSRFEAVIAGRFFALYGCLPRACAKLVWGWVSDKATASASNMPGPSVPMKWLGVPVKSMLFFEPPQGTTSLFITLATFNGSVFFGLGSDASVLGLDDLREATLGFDAALQSLQDDDVNVDLRRRRSGSGSQSPKSPKARSCRERSYSDGRSPTSVAGCQITKGQACDLLQECASLLEHTDL